ncbi:cysteine hydrolase [Epibacterium ulvae]|uniref:cysteine hydrolase family protein n=1 Tax=Epibacterium ulvae TaxID=1156985 RepID=UPI001BFCA201|nr:isochorismatase family cysteine hydrolase [Epibacterium ulvae]MBT8154714.1 cysteine hydrolase [Epibacterium ulvae]
MKSVQAWSDRNFEFDYSTTALIIVDMQRDFVEDEGACGAGGMNVKPLQAVVPRIKSLLERFRENGAPVVHTRYGFKPDMSDLPEAVRLQSKAAGGEYGTPGPLGRILTQGEAGFEILAELSPKPGETVVNKSTFGAFTYTELDKILRGKGVSHVVICGVTTQCCVEGTLREAVDRGYFVLTVADCCGAFEEKLQKGTLDAIQSEAHLFGWIADSQDVLSA